MALAYSGLYALIDDKDFQNRVRFAVAVAAAAAISGNNGKGQGWGQAVVAGKAKNLDIRLLSLRVLATVGDNMTDAQMQATVNGLVPDLIKLELG